MMPAAAAAAAAAVMETSAKAGGKEWDRKSGGMKDRDERSVTHSRTQQAWLQRQERKGDRQIAAAGVYLRQSTGKTRRARQGVRRSSGRRVCGIGIANEGKEGASNVVRA